MGTSLSLFRGLIRFWSILFPRFPISSVQTISRDANQSHWTPVPSQFLSRTFKRSSSPKWQFNELSMQIKDTRRRFIDCSFHSRWNSIPAKGARPGIVDYRDSGRPVLLCDRPFAQGISLITCIPRLTQLSRPLEAILPASGNLLLQVIHSEGEGKVSPTLWGIVRPAPAGSMYPRC